MREWHGTYAEAGLTIIGVHTPNCNAEKDLDALTSLLPLLEIPYPVAADNERKSWAAYHNRYWPTLYLVDRAGTLRFTKIGAGHEGQIEALLIALLAEPPTVGLESNTKGPQRLRRWGPFVLRIGAR